MFAATALCAILALITVSTTSLATFVAVSVSFASVFQSLIEYHNLPQQANPIPTQLNACGSRRVCVCG